MQVGGAAALLWGRLYQRVAVVVLRIMCMEYAVLCIMSYQILYQICCVRSVMSRARPGATYHGAPRSLPLAGAASMGAPAVVVRQDGFVRRDRLWRGAGLALPVFAARSMHSVGCGEFLDLKGLVDLAAAAGLRLLQACPLCAGEIDWAGGRRR